MLKQKSSSRSNRNRLVSESLPFALNWFIHYFCTFVLNLSNEQSLKTRKLHYSKNEKTDQKTAFKTLPAKTSENRLQKFFRRNPQRRKSESQKAEDAADRGADKGQGGGGCTNQYGGDYTAEYGSNRYDSRPEHGYNMPENGSLKLEKGGYRRDRKAKAEDSKGRTGNMRSPAACGEPGRKVDRPKSSADAPQQQGNTLKSLLQHQIKP